MFNKLGFDKKVGIFILRKDFDQPRLKAILLYLKISLMEIDVIYNSIDALLKNKLEDFDPTVCDRKCQVRASMVLDILEHSNFKLLNLEAIQNDLKNLKIEVSKMLSVLQSNNFNMIKQIIESINSITLYDFLKKKRLSYDISVELEILSLCFFLCSLDRQNNQSKYISDIAHGKLKKLIENAKKNLLLYSIDYEKKLAQLYGTQDEIKVIDALDVKGFCIATSFFPSFIPVLKKIKDKKQIILKKTIFFCNCAGVKKIGFNYYRADNFKLEEINVDYVDQDIFTVEGYCFNGSIKSLKKMLNIDFDDIPYIGSEYLKLCICSKSIIEPVIENIEDVLLANFVQHDQYLSKSEIDWESLGIYKSQLKREYDRLKKILGCSLDDMSVFRVIHIYASTVDYELKKYLNLTGAFEK